ncbi:argininosuccinate lyase [Thermaerobacter marianensis DSM 12885]|uniref:Argininosuccinate lyase n=1 Tax=Thermaerobacter marianensis (strain ATCC 700841 / DSM 12885 / JCM 10246 / 7p75a) TaxID=644966 RepID=E6SI49_THEM7|nr:argininosuccinate lyase [Thermaerobacter marianensis]ADU50827.1 argininosuccinate lyase [Thermaerobacter marianensis DSM 12885]
MGIRDTILERDGRQFPGKSYAEAVLVPIFEQAKRHLLAPMLAIHRAHLVMLVERGIVPAGQGRRILAALASIDPAEVARSRYDGRFEDLFFYIEELLIQRAGEVAGNLHIARSRNDMGVAMYRMVLRRQLLDVLDGMVALHQTLVRLAEEHVDTLCLAYTHTQPAQPTTLAHYLLAAADVLARDIERLQQAYRQVNRSPLGAAALTTSGFPVDRQRVAELLGFDGLVENSYDAIASVDYLTEAAAALQLAFVHTGRMVQDLLVWCTQEFGALRLADAYVQCSSIMPQKRNPVGLEHARALLSSGAASAAAVVAVIHNTPFGDIVDSEDDLQPHLWRAAEVGARVFPLLANVVGTVEVNRELLERRARASFATVTELADALVRHHGLDFRTAHRVVARAVARATAAGRTAAEITAADVAAASAEVLGAPLAVAEDTVRQALDPGVFVRVRRVTGGPAPEEVRRMLAARGQVQASLRAWVEERRAALKRAEAELDRACRELATDGAGA